MPDLITKKVASHIRLLQNVPSWSNKIADLVVHYSKLGLASNNMLAWWTRAMTTSRSVGLTGT